MFTTALKRALPALATIAALVSMAACSISEGAGDAAETRTATSSIATPSADTPAEQVDHQPAAESQSTTPPPLAQPESASQSTGTQPPTQPDPPAPAETTAPTPAEPRNVLEIPLGATVEVLGSNRLPGPNGEGTVFADCTDSAGRTYRDGDIVVVDDYGPGRVSKWICRDGMWSKIEGGNDAPAPLEDPPDEGPEIELDQAETDPPTEVFEAPAD